MSILGIDFGEKRIGLAISRGGIAFDFETINFENDDKLIERIKKICEEEKVEKIVIGISKDKERAIGYQGKKQKDFGDKLENELGVDIIFEDEMLSTKEAKRYLSEQNLNQNKIDNLIDQKSAQIILQSYLDRENNA